MPSPPGELTLELERVVPATPPVVFHAFSDPDELAAWWGPAEFTVPSLDFDLRVGDRYCIEMQPPEGDPFNLVGEFREVDPPTRLVFTFAWEEPDPDDVETLAELTFQARGQKTQVVLKQGEFTTKARLDLHRTGWTETFDKLEALLQRS
jgi:uncharacterized protein YndB with AHSA1/START domain